MALTMKKLANLYKDKGSLKAVYRWVRGTADHTSWIKLLALYHQAVAEGLMEPVPVGAKARKQHKEIAADSTPKSKPKPGGQLRATRSGGFEIPPEGQVYSYILTSAQNNTKLHEKLWENILAFKDYLDADLLVSRFAYMKLGLGAKGDKHSFAKRERMGEGEDRWWDARLEPYLSDVREELAPGLIWCGEMNILPTAVRPLSGLEVYTGRRSGIFPHVKLAMQSIASARGEPAKFNYTTGTVTQRNYIQKKEGLKAEFHHCYGALLVQVDSDGDWFVVQLNANSEGTFYAYDMRVKDGEVTTGHRVKGITWGDIHVAEGDKKAYEIAWGAGGMMDVLKPEHQFLHDVLHFRGRSHHEMKNPHTMFRRYIQRADDIRKEVCDVAAFFREAQRPWCKSIVVDSNHHHHLARWLQEQDGRADPVNSEFWLAMSARVYACIHRGLSPNYLYLALQEVGVAKPEKLAAFLAEDESFILCPDDHGGIENGMHGDTGPNGRPGSPLAYARMGRRMNRGHEHSASIVDGVFTSGTCGVLDPDWTHGPSSWSHSQILTYEIGKRAIVTFWNGKWRAKGSM